MDLATAVCAIAAAAIGAGLSWLVLRRTPAGSTWDEWQRAPAVGGSLAPFIGLAALLAVGAGFSGLGLTPPVRAVLIAFPLGTCMPWLVEGTRRWMRAKAG